MAGKHIRFEGLRDMMASLWLYEYAYDGKTADFEQAR